MWSPQRVMSQLGLSWRRCPFCRGLSAASSARQSIGQELFQEGDGQGSWEALPPAGDVEKAALAIPTETLCIRRSRFASTCLSLFNCDHDLTEALVCAFHLQPSNF